MRLSFTLRSGDHDVDLVATTDASASVGELAAHLALADPTRPASLRRALTSGPEARDEPGALAYPRLTLALVDQGMRALDPRVAVTEAGLRSGALLTVVPAGQAFHDRGAPVGTATAIAGPDTGRDFPLSRGTAYIGRERGCDVRLTDPSVSRRHAKLVVGETIELVDLGATNGVLLGGQPVDRLPLDSGDVIAVGDTELRITLHDVAAGVVGGVVGTDHGGIAFSRSPRVAPLYSGKHHVVPELPERGRPQRIPWVMMIIPLMMAGLMFVISNGNVFSAIFMLMMPLMLLGTWWDSRRNAERDYQEAMTDFREDLGLLTEAIRAELAVEAETRRAEHPSAGQSLAAIAGRDPLLWTRRRGDPGFLELRFGLGDLPSRSVITLPAIGRSKAEAWLEVSERMRGLGNVTQVPVVAEPLAYGAIGVCGPRPDTLDVARALLVQLAALHSPADVVLCAFASAASAPAWDVLKWLPHTMSPHSPMTVRHLANTAPLCQALADALDDLAGSDDGVSGLATTAAEPPSDRPVVVVLVEPDAPIARSRLVQLAEKGWRHGVIVIWLASSQAQLPAACRTFLTLTPGDPGQALAGYVQQGEQVTPVAVERVTRDQARLAARDLAPVVDSGVPVDDASDLPRTVALATLLGADLLTDADAVIAQWAESRSILTGPRAPAVLPRKPASLRATIGHSATGAYAIDLRSDGPHALVGGTTGSGKSELLQAWILAMAAAHSPQRVTFLLVDYKGGSAFRDCVRLPHTVGLVTDLSPHLVRRALASLAAELRHREHLLAKFKAKDLVELESRGEVEAPPSLVIVVDEFAALVQEVPEFVDGVVNVAQRGRSLGLHLILATQRPAGVIKDNLRANTNLRMALRMADEADSEDVLDAKDAAYFDPALPGRAMSKTGPGRLVPFQTGYAGGWTSDEPPPADIAVETLVFGAGAPWQIPDDPAITPERVEPGPTDIKRLVATIGAAHTLAELPAPRQPWLPELAAVYDLAALPTGRRDDELVFAVADDPDNQSQPVVAFHPDKEGNLAIYGASGSGKSVLLRTIALAAGFTVRGGPCHVYGLDFGNRGLSMLEGLPHVGAIIGGQDAERISRLLHFLRATIDERAARYTQVSASTITDYRRLAGRPGEPRMIVLIDNMTAFRQAYETGARYRTLDLLAALAADGRPVGVHFVIAADQRAGMPPSLAAVTQRKVVLRMASDDDYMVFSLPSDVLSMASPPGRGLLGDMEIQCAVLGGSVDATAQSRAVGAFAEAIAAAGVPPAPPIEALADAIGLTELPDMVDGMPAFGLASSTLAPIGFAPRGSFVVLGPSGSGRTTALMTLAYALRRCGPDGELYLLTTRPHGALAGLPVFTAVAGNAAECEALATELTARFAAGQVAAPVAVIVERADDVISGTAEAAVTALAKVLVDNEQFIVAEGDTTLFASNYGFAAALKTSRAGLALHPDGNEGTIVFKTDVPAMNRAQAPPGRGYLVVAGRTELVQVAHP